MGEQVAAVLCLALNIGPLRPLDGSGLLSGIDKRPVDGPLQITRLGLFGDAQGDRAHHGGPDKALHHYPADHYEHWAAELPTHAALFRNGGFGENLSTRGLVEADVCVGDRWRLGTALLEVSQGRQPCRRLNLRFDLPDMVERVRRCGRTGWYYRVLEAGEASAGDRLTLVERPHPQWSLARVFAALFGETPDRGDLAALVRLTVLADNWRQRAGRRLLDANGRPAG